MVRYNFGNTPGAGDANTVPAASFQYDTSLPTGREASNGLHPLIITSLDVVMNGRAAASDVTARVDEPALVNPSTGIVTIAPADAARDIYSIPVYKGFTQGGFEEQIARIQLEAGTLFYVGRNSGGPGSVIGAGGLVRPGSLAGGFEYIQVPTAPSEPVVKPLADGTAAVISFTGPSDGGDSPILGYRVEWSDVASFNRNVTWADVATTSTVHGLIPGRRYYWRATARNEVSDWVGALGGQWSTTGTALQPTPNGGGKIFNGTSWVPLKARVFDGTRWVDATRVRVFDGNSWVDAK